MYSAGWRSRLFAGVRLLWFGEQVVGLMMSPVVVKNGGEGGRLWLPYVGSRRLTTSRLPLQAGKWKEQGCGKSQGIVGHGAGSSHV
ncbi:hypothetical protein B0T18DRAFT_138215 [Schizothecium vesticola]|uniref:Secreted protein n=1 Tax=Schizothecium vesticola TaxID=314040 RepID=A0AA40EUU1_9PEZI|nr:hypothetical protein B0T18DRAFT_138215 [Schizothecium vesticola]